MKILHVSVNSDFSGSALHAALELLSHTLSKDNDLSEREEERIKDYYFIRVGLEDIGRTLAVFPPQEYYRVGIDPKLTGGAWYLQSGSYIRIESAGA